MLKLFTYPSSIESKSVRTWLTDNAIPFKEIELFDQLVTIEELKQMTSLTDMGALDIIAPEYLAVVQHLFKDGSISLTELYEAIQNEPKLLNLPILYDDKRLCVGYKVEELQKFLPSPTKLIMEY